MAITKHAVLRASHIIYENTNGEPTFNDPRLKVTPQPVAVCAGSSRSTRRLRLALPSQQSNSMGWSTRPMPKILAAGGTVPGGTDNPIGIRQRGKPPSR